MHSHFSSFSKHSLFEPKANGKYKNQIDKENILYSFLPLNCDCTYEILNYQMEMIQLNFVQNRLKQIKTSLKFLVWRDFFPS